MNIRKGTEVRIRRTNEIGTIEEVELIRKGGEVHKCCHLKTAQGKPNLWLDADELAPVHQLCEAVFTDCDSGRSLKLTFDVDHRTGSMTVKVQDAAGGYMDMDEKGLHITLINRLVKAF